jgi:hypothetical protein
LRTIHLSATVAALAVVGLFHGILSGGSALAANSIPSQVVSVPDTGWHVCLDPNAAWKNEQAYLPGDSDLSKMETHPPTGGWSALDTAHAQVVTLPTTVEQHFWGVGGLRPYRGEYIYEGDDPQPLNGNYEGVSWWWRTVQIPAGFAGKTVILHIRAAKQRAEVFVNRRFVGYSLVAETAFDCDITNAVVPGQSNTIAIRITNPGGRLDWGDWGTAGIGKVSFYAGHAFGGLDRAITISAHGPVRFTDSWVLNHPDPHLVTAYGDLTNSLAKPESGKVIATVIDPKSGKKLVSKAILVSLAASGEAHVSIDLPVPTAKLWSLEAPNLYTMRIAFVGSSIDTRDTTFGFRWFGPAGVGSHAKLVLNGKRIRVYSAISWGYYGINGLWPTPYLAEKEVKVAKSIGLNAINFHRNIARAESLDAADRMGLLRYTEPGGGTTLFWDRNSTANNLQRYMMAKIAGMVRDARSHPSLMLYVIQNELDDKSYQHPLAPVVLRMVHELDPSRAVVFKSGISSPGEMWMAPYDNTLRVDDGSGYSGWWDAHTVGYPDSWNDGNYKSPTDHVYYNDDKREIVDYGEMGGSGTADNHALMVKQIESMGGQSYDLLDHEQIDLAYNRFLDRWDFRTAFPTTYDLYEQIGAKQYEYWRNVLQCARLSDSNDYLTVSGWETTAIENHGGIVDNLRNPHGDPAVIHGALRPVLPAIELTKTAVLVGDKVGYDLAFLNETDRPIHGTLKVELTAPTGVRAALCSYPIPTFQTDVFAYQVATGLTTPALTKAGDYTIAFSLGKISESRTIHVIALPPAPAATIGVIGGGRTAADLASLGAQSETYQPSQNYPLAIALSDGVGAGGQTDDTVQNTADPELYRDQRYGRRGYMRFVINGLPDGPAKVTLGFVETFWNRPGARVFDVDIDGKPVLRDLDIFALAGGKDKVWTATVDATVSGGALAIEPGVVKTDNAIFNTIQIQTATRTVAYYMGNKPYTARDGAAWLPYTPTSSVDDALLAKVYAGMNLLIVADDDASAQQAGDILAKAKILAFGGLVGHSRAPWMGNWYFVRANPMYAGLPVNEVMKGDYQVSVGDSDGMVVDGPNVRIFTAYSRDHSRTIGAGDFEVPYGQGKIVVHAVPRMNDAFELRWLDDTIRVLAQKS